MASPYTKGSSQQKAQSQINQRNKKGGTPESWAAAARMAQTGRLPDGRVKDTDGKWRSPKVVQMNHEEAKMAKRPAPRPSMRALAAMGYIDLETADMLDRRLRGEEEIPLASPLASSEP